MSDGNKILFVTATRIGDAILSTGLLSHLLDRHPDARFTIACGAPAAPLFSSFPNLDRLIVIRKKPLKRHWLELWSSCLGTRWDLVVDLRSSGLAWGLRSKERRVKRVRGTTMHRIEELAGVLGVTEAPAPKIWSSVEHQHEAAELIPDGGPVLMLGPTANWAGKEWRLEHFVALVRKLSAPDGLFPGARVAVLGSREERARALPFIEAMPKEQLIDLFGLGLLASYECIRRCEMFIGNDSGLMHLSAASGVPTLGLFGPTREWHYRPWGPNSAVVRTRESYEELVNAPDFDHRRTGTLMNGLSVEAVAEAADALWQRTRAPT